MLPVICHLRAGSVRPRKKPEGRRKVSTEYCLEKVTDFPSSLPDFTSTAFWLIENINAGQVLPLNISLMRSSLRIAYINSQGISHRGAVVSCRYVFEWDIEE